MSRKNINNLRSGGRERGAGLQHLLAQPGELPHAGDVVQGQQPQPILQVASQASLELFLRAIRW